MMPQHVKTDYSDGNVVHFPTSNRVDRMSSVDVRLGNHPEEPCIVDQLVMGYLTVLAGAAGAGKTTLVEQIVRHVSSGHQLGRFDLPDAPLESWCWFLEDVPSMAQDRSLRVARRGALDEDRTGQTNVAYYFDRGHGIMSIQAELEAAASGEFPPPGLIIVDYLRRLVGPQPPGISINDWEQTNLRKMRELGKEFGCHFIVLTHTNKQGQVTGTTESANSSDGLFVIERNTEDRGTATLACRKMRLADEIDYALCRKDNGTWGFDDQVYVSETQSVGIAKQLLSVLRKQGPHTLAELCTHPDVYAQRTGIQKTLTRMRKRGQVERGHGHWSIVATAGDQLSGAAPELTCTRCTLPMTRDLYGNGMHANCKPPVAEVPAPVPAPRAALEEPADDGDDQEHDQAAADSSAYTKLRESISSSKVHPLPNVPKQHRNEEPWTLVSDRMSGEPSALLWSRPASDGATVAVIDRNGSYPSAMGSVAVAPNRLTHTGPLDQDGRKGRAGIFLVDVPEWTDDRLPHPLGAVAAQEGPVWITSPHLELLDKLAKLGEIQAVTVHDSWTGRRSTDLFKGFAGWARDARAETVGTDRYGATKKDVVLAIRALHCETRSPFWRPDWHASVVAEAAVRHWAKARQAVHAGDVLLSLEDTDAAAFLVPDGVEDPKLWAPSGYTLGTKFGQIKHKDDVIIVKGGRKRKGVKAPSPLTAEQWNVKGGHRG